MESDTRARAWHIAGHAWLAVRCGFRVERLSLDGFTEAERDAAHASAQRLDEWTMLRIPESPLPPGTFEHTNFMQDLCHIALAGPISELLYLRQTSTVSSVEQYKHDWKQAWKAARWVFRDETARRWWLGRTIQQGHTYIGLEFASYFMSPLVEQLLEQRSLDTDEVHYHWDRLQENAAV
jgi:hypothetical protein